jgi:stress response protein YsnF
MARNTVVGVFESSVDAERAVEDLLRSGFDRARVELACNESALALASERSSEHVTTGATHAPSHSEQEGLGDRISNFFRSLFGSEDADEDAAHYSEAVRRGGAVVTVTAQSEEEADRAADILDARGVVDIQQRSREWQQTGWAGSPAPARDASLDGDREQVIPVVKEELQVGKRRRERGGVRIYTHMDEESVSENVRLREEHATVERRPADRPATEADFAAFKEGTIEVRETVEEPVVAKKARVVEEVVVNKEVSERTEKVVDSVRNVHVDVENVSRSADTRGRSTTRSAEGDRKRDSDYRNHWQTSYARAGGRYEDYEPAYRYGSTLAEEERYRGRNWNDIEPNVRRDWETRHPGSGWESFKAAVRHGWERVTGRS